MKRAKTLNFPIQVHIRTPNPKNSYKHSRKLSSKKMALKLTTTKILRETSISALLKVTISSPKPFTYTPRYLSFLSSTPRHVSTFPNPSLQPQSFCPHSIIAKNQTLNLGFSGFMNLTIDSKVEYSSISAVSGGGSGGSGGGSDGGGPAGGGGEGGSNSKWNLLSWYLDLLAKFPVLTKAVTSAFLTLVGDLICQLVIDKASTLDYKRTFIFTFLGLALVGPTLHYWYLYLSKLVTIPGASGAFLRLVLDQFVFAPIFIGVFLSTLMTLEGRASQVVPKLQQEWFSSVLANWQLWLPFQFLNFRFVPQQFQVLASNFVALVWNVILSFKAHKEVVEK